MQDGRSDPVQQSASRSRAFKPATPEDQIIFRKWMRGVLLFYGAIAVALVFVMEIRVASMSAGTSSGELKSVSVLP
jgi:hypothetical protein